MKSENPTIVIIAFNRPDALERLLRSVATADYQHYQDIRLVISIDGGGDKYNQVYDVSNLFIWKYGEKVIIPRTDNLGLRNHVIKCGELTTIYNNIIILEEDCFVSKNYYDYAYNSLIIYSTEPRIVGISLYSYTYYESAGMPFTPLKDGFDTFFMQVPSSLGQVWSKEHWQGFMDFYNKNPKIEENDRIPEKVKKWPETSWKKYFYKYMVEKDFFFVYPQCSFSTNFGDTGTHLSAQTQLYQVQLENYQNLDNYKFSQFMESFNKYDAYFELLPECLIAKNSNISPNVCIDLYGTKPLDYFYTNYWLSSKCCDKFILSFDDVLIPIVQNVICNLKGNTIFYAERSKFSIMLNDKKIRQIANSQPLGYNAGIIKIISGKYYKIGFYLFHPLKLGGFVKRKFLKFRQQLHLSQN